MHEIIKNGTMFYLMRLEGAGIWLCNLLIAWVLLSLQFNLFFFLFLLNRLQRVCRNNCTHIYRHESVLMFPCKLTPSSGRKKEPKTLKLFTLKVSAGYHGNPSYLVWGREVEIKEIHPHTNAGRGKDPKEKGFKQMTARRNMRRSFLSSVCDSGKTARVITLSVSKWYV